MSAPKNRGIALQRVKNNRFGGENDGISVQMRLKSHYFNFNRLVLDFGASYSDHP